MPFQRFLSLGGDVSASCSKLSGPGRRPDCRIGVRLAICAILSQQSRPSRRSSNQNRKNRKPDPSLDLACPRSARGVCRALRGSPNRTNHYPRFAKPHLGLNTAAALRARLFFLADRTSTHAMNPEMIGTSRKDTTAVVSPASVCLIHREVKSATVQGRTKARTTLRTIGTSSGFGDLSVTENLAAMIRVLHVSKL